MGAQKWDDRYATVVGDTSWQQRAACKEELLLFLDKDTTAAKNLCLLGCPVRLECLQFALDNDCGGNVWGGLDENERKALKKKKATA